MRKMHLFRTLLLAALLPLPMAPSHSQAAVLEKTPATAAGADAGCEIDKENYQRQPIEVIRQVQEALAYFNLYSNRIDNIVGRDTRAGLSSYCKQRGLVLGRDPASQQALIDELLRDSAVDRVYRNWRDIVGSKGFSLWAAEQKDRDQITVQAKSGTPAQIIDIIDRFLKYRPEALKAGGKRWPDDQAISYQLTADDFKALAERQSTLSKLAKLRGGGYQERSAFLAQVRGLLKEDADSWLDLVEQYAESMSVLTLGPQGISRLKAARVPDYLLERLGELEDPGYASRSEAEKALRSISVELVQELKDLRNGAQKAGNGKVADQAPVVQAAAAEDSLTAEVSLRLQNASAANGKQRSAALARVSQELLDETEKWLPVIMGQLEEETAYRLTENAWAKLSASAGAIPAYALAMLEGMQDVDYPIRSQFNSAARSRIQTRLEEYFRQIQESVASRRLTRLDDKFFEGLKTVKLPGELVAKLTALKDKEFLTARELTGEIDAILKTQEALVPGYLDYLANQGRKKHFLDTGKAIQWSPIPDCRCLPKRMKDRVYGFYPYWLAGEAQTLDFSVLNRIGYYALGFDDGGVIQVTGHWDADSSQVFEMARRYRTQVDLVLRRSDWAAWAAQSREKRQAAFDRLAESIAKELGITPTDPLSRMKPVLSLGTAKPRLGNGVTLFFEHYPEESEFVEDFGRFIDRLRKHLARTGQFVNIMLPGEDLGKGIFGYSNLLRWAELYGGKSESGVEVNDRMLILVLLQEPFGSDKKHLRIKLEENLRGAERRNLQRMMLPVIVPDGRSRIDDDVVYMGDNYGGIGFWPLPAGDFGELSSHILKAEYFPKSTNQNNAVCGVVCPNRWLFRLAFNLSLLASLICLTAFVTCCECRDNFRRNFIWYLAGTVVPFFLLGMILLYCDPYLESVSEGNSLLFLTLLGIIVYAIWDYHRKRQEIP